MHLYDETRILNEDGADGDDALLEEDDETEDLDDAEEDSEDSDL